MLDPLLSAMGRLVKHPNLTPTFLALAVGIPEAEMRALLDRAVENGWLSEHQRCCGLSPLLTVTAAGHAALEG